MEYILLDSENNKHKFHLSYSELKDKYYEFLAMSDKDFLKHIPSAIHFACIVCFLKEIPTYIALSDFGIVHELVHLISIVDYRDHNLKRIRKLFDEQLKLA